MNAKRTNLRQMNVPGNDDLSSNRESLNARLKQWRQRLGYCSLLAALPAMLVSDTQKTRAEAATEPEVNVPGRGTRLLERLNRSSTNPALLKRQSKFRLPHQNGSFAMVAALGGTDDCPGATVLGGSYTAAAPLVVAGDTTGANDTVTSLPYYYTYDAHGPDHVYSFTLTSRGANPQIEVSTSSVTYRPLIYVLQGGPAGACPAGTGNSPNNILVMNDSRWTTGSTATLDNSQMNYLPLNVPLHLFVDSAVNDASGAGPYTIRMQDVTIAPAAACANPNPIDCPEFLVRQQYLDFLSREPEPQGFADWMAVLNSCNGDSSCLYGPNGKRTLVSQSFFGSQEFNLKGGYVFRFYKASLARTPTYAEMVADMAFVTGATADEVNQKRAAFASNWVLRADFLNAFSRNLTPSEFVDNISQTAGIILSNRSQIITDLSANNTDAGRANALRAIVDSQEEQNHEFNSSFVYMQYVGYLRRDPEPAGYNDWLTYLNTHPGDFNTMVWGFVDSLEYRHRFGP